MIKYVCNVLRLADMADIFKRIIATKQTTGYVGN